LDQQYIFLSLDSLFLEGKGHWYETHIRKYRSVCQSPRFTVVITRCKVLFSFSLSVLSHVQKQSIRIGQQVLGKYYSMLLFTNNQKYTRSKKGTNNAKFCQLIFNWVRSLSFLVKRMKCIVLINKYEPISFSAINHKKQTIIA
jgi:hypothetical protein